MNKPSQPFLLRLTSSQLPNWLVGVLTCVFFVLLQALVFEIEGIKHSYSLYSTTFFFILTTGYLVFISRIINNNHEKGFFKLLSCTKLNESEKQDHIQEFHDQKLSWKEMLIPICIGLLHGFFVNGASFSFKEVPYPFLKVYSIIQILIIWIMIWQSTSTYLRNMTKMNRLSRAIEIDILNTEQLMPLTSAGVISILAFVGVYTILFIESIDSIELYNPALLPLIPSIVWMVVTPLSGVRKRIISAKELEIGLIEKGIEGDKKALEKSRIGNNLENINVVDLMTYKRLITATPEIPINIPTASRFIFYLIIPFFTWVAASIVDKAIDYLIG